MNQATDKLISLEIEKTFLGGLFRNPQVIYETESFLKEGDFHNKMNQTIFIVCREILLQGQELSKTLVAQKVKELNVGFKDGLSPFDYIDSITMAPINAKGTLNNAKELVKLRIRRDIYSDAQEVQSYVLGPNCSKSTVAKMISDVDGIYNKRINSITTDDEPIDLYAQLEERIRERAANPVNEIGLVTPFTIFNQFFGGLRSRNGLYNIISRSGEGKALEENTWIPTPDGFVKIKDLEVGSYVFAPDGSITTVTNKTSWKKRKIYKVITDDGHEVLADENHEWTVKRRSGYDWEKLETKQIHNNPLKSQRRCKLPIHGPLQLPKLKLPIDPYILGVWLGDGSSSSPTITNKDRFIIDKWKSYAEENGLNVSKRGKLGYIISNNWKGNILLDGLRDLKLINSSKFYKGFKHIPNIYLRSSIEQRKKLLQGLIDTDGFVNPIKGETEYCTINKELAEGVLELIHSLGIKARLCKNKAKLYNKDCGWRYRIRFYYKESALLPRKRKYCKDGIRTPNRYIETKFHGYGNTVCIEVGHPSHMFLCGKAMIPTHNSTYLFNMAKGVARLNNCPVLYLDTEMDLELNSWRAGGGEAIVNPWFLETGQWVNNAELIKKVEASFKEYKNYTGKIYHKQCPNASINEIIGMIRKWYFKRVGRGNPCLVVYDYLKITSDIDKNRQEWQQLGDKVSMLNEIGSNLDIHLWSAGQQNRSAQQNGQRNDDSTTVGGSDRINMYACFNATFREKTLDEVTEHGAQFGTHLLKPFKVSRTQGQDSYFKHRNVRVVDRQNNRVVYRQNFINYNINEFAVSECGTYADVIKSQERRDRLQDDHDNHDDVAL